jgi:acyl carrier protein
MKKKLTDIEINEKLILSIMNVLGQYIEIDIDTKIETLLLDSLDEVELVLNLEKEFNITIDDEYVESMMKEVIYIRDIKQFLKKYGIFDIKENRKLKIHQLDATPRFPSVKFASAETFFKATEKMLVVKINK